MHPKLSVYLAGPVSNCNKKQQSEWRVAIKRKLKEAGHSWFDPTEYENWTPLREMVEIDKSDAVIANMWRESIGTVVGIVQARRKGKPVILIDPNYLESNVLARIVASDMIVRGVDEAINLLGRVHNNSARVVHVAKRDREPERFSFAKLHQSLHKLFASAQVEDAILPDLVANEVSRRLLETKQDRTIQSTEIRRLVFETLDKVAKDNRYEDELQSWRERLRQAWDQHDSVKKDQRAALAMMDEQDQNLDRYKNKLENLEEVNAALEAENGDLRHQVRVYERKLDMAGVGRGGGEDNSFIQAIERAFGKRRGLCVCSVRMDTYRRAFIREGLDEQRFDQFFEVRHLDGQQSQLVHNMKEWVRKYAFVLYAWHGLRHSDSDLGGADNLIRKSSANDVVSEFSERIRRGAARVG